MKKKVLIVLGVLVVIVGTLIFQGSKNIDKMISSQDFSTIIYDRNGEILRIYLNKEEQFVLPPNSNFRVPEKLKEAVVAFEDKDFYTHLGVAPKGIARAIWLNVKSGRRVSGGSTITMQTIKMLRGGKRNYVNKVIEIFYAFILEAKFTKEEILDLYLSNVPYGKNIRGYRGAILKYYGDVGENITWSQAASLAILPNSPSLITFKKRKDEFLKKKNRLLKVLFNEGEISQGDYELSIQEDPPEYVFKVPQEAMFFSDYTKKESKDLEVYTTLDLKVQNLIESVVKNNKYELEQNDIYNTAIMVIDTKNREILGYIGGTFENRQNGMIDALQAKRNVGSTLKPFLYGLSMDKGLISSRSKLEDIPVFFRSFSPVNSDKKYRGLVRANDALQLSLNIPMVKLLQEYKVENFKDFFDKTRLIDIDMKTNYGLSMVLGTLEMTPYELASLYTGLGNLGNFQPLRYLKEDKKSNQIENQLISKGATYLTLDIMKGLRRNNENWGYYQNKKILYWKTGTSYGERDAWAVGTNKDYTILVWNGNLDNRPGNHLNGIHTSAPLLFQILDGLETKSGVIEKPIEKLRRVKITENGFRSKYNNTVEEVYIPKNTILKLDPYEKKIFVDTVSNVEVDSRDWEGKNYTPKIVNIYSKEMISFLESKGEKVNDIQLKDSKTIKFIYPTTGMKVKQPYSKNGETKVMIQISSSTDGRSYNWYINNKFIKTSTNSKEFFSLSRGKNTVLVVTNTGKTASVTFWVE